MQHIFSFDLNGQGPVSYLVNRRGDGNIRLLRPLKFLISIQFLSLHINGSHLKGITIGNTNVKKLADNIGLSLWIS